MQTVLRAFYLDEYKILLEFEGHIFKIVDLENELWGPIFEPLKKIGYFKKFKVKDGTICWPNSADFCPDVLFKMGIMVEIQPKQKIA